MRRLRSYLHICAQDRRPGDCTTNLFDLSILLANRDTCPHARLLCGRGPQLTCGESAQSGSGSRGGPGSSPLLTEVLAQMGFDSVDEHQAYLTAASESEAFVCACVLQVLLEAQP